MSTTPTTPSATGRRNTASRSSTTYTNCTFSHGIGFHGHRVQESPRFRGSQSLSYSSYTGVPIDQTQGTEPHLVNGHDIHTGGSAFAQSEPVPDAQLPTQFNTPELDAWLDEHIGEGDSHATDLTTPHALMPPGAVQESEAQAGAEVETVGSPDHEMSDGSVD